MIDTGAFTVSMRREGNKYFVRRVKALHKVNDNIYDFEGNHITAADLQWFYDKYCEQRTLANIKSFVATGEYTGQMVLNYRNYPGFLSRSAASIVAVSQAEYEKNPERFRSDPVEQVSTDALSSHRATRQHSSRHTTTGAM